MITKTYFDGKLNEFESRIERKISARIDQLADRLDAEILKIKEETQRAVEKGARNEDVIYGYLKDHNNIKKE